jgi:hypothetical protein
MTMLTRMGLVAAIAAAMAAAPALADRGGVPHNGGGQGNDHAAQSATPAQPGDPGDGAQPATPAQPADQSGDDGQDKSHGNGRGHHESSDDTKSQRTASAPSSSHAKAGKTTICHATGSATNPYVEITISNNALPAHQRHQDGRDIIPAPDGGCPQGQARSEEHGSKDTEKGKDKSGEQHASAPSSSHAKAGKTTICHATGSATNPYVEITISNNALPAHERHQDGRDIVPAPADGCPSAAAQPVLTPTALQTLTPPTETLAGQAPAPTPQSGVLGVSETSTAPQETTKQTVTADSSNDIAPQHAVLGERVSRGVSRSATRSVTRRSNAPAALRTLPAESSSSGSTLPFTGLDLGIVAAIGAAMLLAGVALKRARRISRIRP